MIPWSPPAPSRARRRRRMGEAVAGVQMAPILVEDDEDEVVISSPRAHAQARNKARVDAHRFTRATRGLAVEDPFELRVEVHHSTRRGLEATLDDFMEVNRGRAGRGEASVEEVLEVFEASRARVPAVDLSGIPLDPLEWRLGPGVEGHATGRRGRPARTTIDLTTAPARRSAPPNEDCVVLLEYTKNPRKRKPVLVPEDPVLVREVAPEPTPAPPPPPPPAVEDYRFKCAICMENLKDETSTICGHIFCGACIKEAVQAQKKCPTCRKKLNMKNIHRIYL